jgi:hypothetical protein
VLFRNLSFVMLFMTVSCAHLGATEEERSASLTVYNLSDVGICEINVAARTQSTWGENMLPEHDLLSPGDAHTIYMRAGYYGVHLTDCRGHALYERRGLYLVGARRLDFRPIAVQRDPRFGTRRFANGNGTETF